MFKALFWLDIIFFKEIEIFPLQKIWTQSSKINQGETQIQIEAIWKKQMNFIKSEMENSYWNKLTT